MDQLPLFHAAELQVRKGGQARISDLCPSCIDKLASSLRCGQCIEQFFVLGGGAMRHHHHHRVWRIRSIGCNLRSCVHNSLPSHIHTGHIFPDQVLDFSIRRTVKEQTCIVVLPFLATGDHRSQCRRTVLCGSPKGNAPGHHWLLLHTAGLLQVLHLPFLLDFHSPMHHNWSSCLFSYHSSLHRLHLLPGLADRTPSAIVSQPSVVTPPCNLANEPESFLSSPQEPSSL